MLAIADANFAYDETSGLYYADGRAGLTTVKVQNGKIVSIGADGQNILCENVLTLEEIKEYSKPSYEFTITDGKYFAYTDIGCNHSFVYNPAKTSTERSTLVCTKCGFTTADCGDYSSVADDKLTSAQVSDLILNSKLCLAAYYNGEPEFAYFYDNGLVTYWNLETSACLGYSLYRKYSDNVGYFEYGSVGPNLTGKVPDDFVFDLIYPSQYSMYLDCYDTSLIASYEFAYDEELGCYVATDDWGEETFKVTVTDGKITDLEVLYFNYLEFKLYDGINYTNDISSELSAIIFNIENKDGKVTVYNGQDVVDTMLDQPAPSTEDIYEAFILEELGVVYDGKSSISFDTNTGRSVTVEVHDGSLVVGVIEADGTTKTIDVYASTLEYHIGSGDGSVSTNISYSLVGNKYIPVGKSEYIYGEKHGNNTDYDYIKYVYNLALDQWDEKEKEVYKYNSYGSRILEQKYNWDALGKKWVLQRDYRYDYYVDSMIYSLEKLYDVSNPNNPYLSDQQETRYDSKGRTISYERYTGDYTGDLTGYSKYEKAYDDETGIITTHKYAWDSSTNSFYLDNVEAVLYDENYNYLYHTYIQYNTSGVITGSYGYIKTYDANQNDILSVNLRYDSVSGEWYPYQQYEYEYDANGNVILDIKSILDESDNLVLSSKDVYEYNDANKNTLYEYWTYDVDAEKWVGEYKYVYAYDNFQNKILDASYYWFDELEDFVECEETQNLYDSTGEEIIYHCEKQYNNALGKMFVAIEWEKEYSEQYGKYIGKTKESRTYDSFGRLNTEVFYEGWSNEHNDFICLKDSLYTYKDGRLYIVYMRINPTHEYDDIENYIVNYYYNSDTTLHYVETMKQPNPSSGYIIKTERVVYYDYDANGNPASAIYSVGDANGENWIQVTKEVYTYDDKGEIVDVKTYTYDASNPTNPWVLVED